MFINMCPAPCWALGVGWRIQIGSSSNSNPDLLEEEIFELDLKSCQASNLDKGYQSQSWLLILLSCAALGKPLPLSVFIGTSWGWSRGFWASGLINHDSVASVITSDHPLVYGTQCLPCVQPKSQPRMGPATLGSGFSQLGHLGHDSLTVEDPLFFELANIF